MVYIIYQKMSQMKRTADIRYIHEKLREITEQQFSQKVLVVTDDRYIKELLNEINKLLDFNQGTMAKYHKTEKSMKRMLSNFSHDLKTPLTVVLGYIETIIHDSGMSMEERANLLLKVHGKAQEVLQLMNKFFDLAKLESGDKEIPLKRLNMNEICKKNILAFYDILTAKGFDVVIDVPSYPLYALGNEDELERVFNNLISNAITYGSDGKTVGLSLRSDEKFVYVDIWDKGKGIREYEQEQIFERMYTLEDSRNQAYQGSGLGLTITKHLIENLGGGIFVNSKPFEKTTFTFHLKKITF